jgi:glycine cleavage system transcriptional repressor
LIKKVTIMANWQMLTVVGRDRPGIVARITTALYSAGCNLGEASMLRLGGNFTIMLMVDGVRTREALLSILQPVMDELSLRCHLDPMDGQLHDHLEPDVEITLHGADRAGIVAQVTGALASAGLHILNLDTDVGGSQSAPIYVMRISGHAGNGIEPLAQALATIRQSGIESRLTTIETMIG